MNKIQKCLRGAGLFLAAALSILGVTQNSFAGNGYPFPAKAVDLDPGQAWFLQHDHKAGIQEKGYDLTAVRWKDSGGWTRVYHSSWDEYDQDPNKKNSDWVVYGRPVYAIEDGEVTGCWRNAPENPKPGEHHTMLDKETYPKIGGGGNAVRVKHADGNYILYAHFQPGTVPTSLCPHNDTYVPYDGAGDIPEGSRPQVKRGQFLGLVGNSGNSSNPHLHLHIQNSEPGTGDADNAVPLPFYNVWTQGTDNPGDILEDWNPLVGQALTNPPLAVYPSPFLRKHDATAGTIYDVSLTNVTSVGTVTAVQDGFGNLKLITWAVDETGAIVRKHDETAGYATQIQIAHPGYTRDVVTALRDGGGNLKLIGWDISQNGGISRKGDASAGAVGRVAMVPFPDFGTGVITAVKTAQGDLKVIAWKVDNLHSKIERKGDVTDGPAAEVSITKVVDGRTAAQEINPAGQFKGVVTAVRDGQGNLKLASFEMGADHQFEKKDEAHAGAISQVAISTVRLSNLREMVVTAVRQADGKLKLIAWEISASGQITRKGDLLAGAIYGLEMSRFGNSNLITAVRAANGNLRLIAWHVNSDGSIDRDGENDAGAVYKMAIADRMTIGGRPYVVGAFQTGDGNLKTISWEMNLRP